MQEQLDINKASHVPETREDTQNMKVIKVYYFFDRGPKTAAYIKTMSDGMTVGTEVIQNYEPSSSYLSHYREEHNHIVYNDQQKYGTRCSV